MNNQQLINSGLILLGHIQDERLTASSDTAVLQRIDPQNSKLTAHLIAERQADGAGERDVLQLFRKIEAGFDESELGELCFELGVDVEDLNGRNRLDKIRSLITHLERRNRLPDLVKRCAALRTDTDWGVTEEGGRETAILSKLNITVVIDIARPALRNVATYLDYQRIDANFIVFRHKQAGQFFSVHDDWQQLAITFGDVMDRIKREFNGACLHFFMAGPGALLFSMGCIWGTVDEAVVYHYENSLYHPVLSTTRKLRQISSGWT
ncbi:MAG: SAVED domain-containing protein [Chloroflexi bacterium]|nr:SAVED domain-containing protein [Chloroflexota bacterium]